MNEKNEDADAADCQDDTESHCQVRNKPAPLAAADGA